jgi:NADH-quinone oxidoreductase subunit J|tara:strand:+ start:5239 stop:5814 length:576 start_codon:yes stop_codon:yes gene_type:complete
MKWITGQALKELTKEKIINLALDNIFSEIVFWVLATLSIVSAVLVIHLKSIFRSALMLLVSFVGVAGIFAILNAEFLAIVQVLIYGGGITVLIIFAIMMTTDVDQGNQSNKIQLLALLSAISILGVLTYSIIQAQWKVLPSTLPEPMIDVFVNSPAYLGHLLLNEFVLAFEIAGVLLLAVVVGALSLVRED